MLRRYKKSKQEESKHMELESPNQKNERASLVELGIVSEDCFNQKLKNKVLPSHPSDWKEAPAKISYDRLEILNRSVMERWEEPLMRELAKIATSKGGTILELGFGLGISAGYIQKDTYSNMKLKSIL
jgi:hypothetical protein